MNQTCKHIMILLVIICAMQRGWAQPTMHIQMNDGRIVYYNMEQYPTVTYSGTELIVHIKSTSDHYAIDDIKNLSYSSIAVVPAITQEEYPIRVYTMSGQYVATLEKAEDIQSWNSPYGVYVLRSQNNAKKIVAR